MKRYCDGNCSACRFAVYGSTPEYRGVGTSSDVSDRTRKPVTVAVTSTYAVYKNETVVFGDLCIRFVFLSEISSIIDLCPDVVLNLVDSTDLDSTIYPVTKFIDMGLKFVMALENYGKLLDTGHSINYAELGNLTDSVAIPADFGTEDGMMAICAAVSHIYESQEEVNVQVPYGMDVEEAIGRLSDEIGKGMIQRGDTVSVHVQADGSLALSPRYYAVRLLEKQDYILPYIDALPNSRDILKLTRKELENLRKEFTEGPEVLVAKARRGFINGALQATLRHSDDNSDHTVSQKIDTVLTHRFLGLPLLVLVLFLVFEATFFLGAYPQEWIEGGVSLFSGWLSGLLPSGWLSSMVVDGIVQGVGAVLAFLPNIVILFFFLSLLEDSGYMARAAFVMDKIMHRIGLHGRSFVPMLIGFGCNVPAIMAARSIEDRKDRTLTMLMIPFMSCSARLPVYMLFVSAFFAGHKALVMISIYITGILLSIVFAFLMKRTRFFRKGQDDHVCELPDFRMPTLRNTGAHIWERVSDYLQKISTVILMASVVIWALEYFPSSRTNGGELKEESYLADVGRWMAPVTAPLGFDWKMNVCILTGLPAKEAIVSTMGILYHTDDESSLADIMRSQVYTDGPRIGQKVFTPSVAIAFMLFVLLYFPCIATVATLKREIGGGWAAFTVVHSLLLAWIVAFVAFHVF